MSKLIITDNAQWLVPAGDNVSVVGTNDANMVAVAQGVSVDFDGSFSRGGDDVYIEADSGDFNVSLSGAAVTLTNTADDSTITINAGAAGQALTFGDGFLNLVIDTSGDVAVVMLGDQALVSGAAPAAITAVADGSVTSDSVFESGGLNVVPAAEDDTFDVSTGAQDLDVLLNDADSDLDHIFLDDTNAIVMTSQPDGATVTATYDLVDNDINFEADTAGTYTFEYAVKDNHGGTDTAVATVNVTDALPVFDLQEGTSDPVAATADADIFAFDAVAALGMTENTQIVVSGFDTAADSLQLDIATAGGVDSLDDLNGVDGISVQTNIITGTTINFGNDADGDVVVIQLAGVTDASLVQIEAV